MKPESNGHRKLDTWIKVVLAGLAVATFFIGRVSVIEERAAASQKVLDRVETIEKDAAVLKRDSAATEAAIKTNLNGVVLQQSQIQDGQKELAKRMDVLTQDVIRSNAQTYELARTNMRLRELATRVNVLNLGVSELSGTVAEHSKVVEQLTKRVKRRLGETR